MTVQQRNSETTFFFPHHSGSLEGSPAPYLVEEPATQPQEQNNPPAIVPDRSSMPEDSREEPRRTISFRDPRFLNVAFHIHGNLAPNRESWKVKSLKITYTQLLQPSTEQADLKKANRDQQLGQEDLEGNSNECPICLEDSPTFYHCENHLFHDTCIIRDISSKTDSIANVLARTKNSFLRADHYVRERFSSHKRYTHSSYSVNLPLENLPNCPLCRTAPSSSDVEIEGFDSEKDQKFYASVQTPGRSAGLLTHFLSAPLLKELTTALTVFQAALAHVQRRPEMTAIVYKAQRLFLISDIAIVLSNYWKLYIEASKRKEQIKKLYAEHKNAIFVGIGVASVAFGALGIYLYRRPTSSIDLKEILSQCVSKSDQHHITANWATPPFMQLLIQFLYANRVATEIALAFFAKNRLLHLTNAAVQTYSLFRISQLKWIEFNREIPSFFLKEIADKSSSNEASSVDRVYLNLRFLVPSFMDNRRNLPSCTDEHSHLEPILKTAYQYSTKLFERSSWEGSITHVYQSGIRVSSILNYDVTTKEPLLDSCACIVKPWLERLSAVAPTRTYYGYLFGRVRFLFS